MTPFLSLACCHCASGDPLSRPLPEGCTLSIPLWSSRLDPPLQLALVRLSSGLCLVKISRTLFYQSSCPGHIRDCSSITKNKLLEDSLASGVLSLKICIVFDVFFPINLLLCLTYLSIADWSQQACHHGPPNMKPLNFCRRQHRGCCGRGSKGSPGVSRLGALFQAGQMRD